MLSDTRIKKIKKADKPQKFYDADGLFLLVSTAGGKHWKLKFSFAGKEQQLALGKYPVVTLKEARTLKEEALSILAKGIDPGGTMSRRAQKNVAIEAADNTFETIARDWHKCNEKTWKKDYAAQIISTMERELFPKMGARPVAEIKPPEILRILQQISNSGKRATAHRLKQTAGKVFRFAVASGTAERDPTQDLQGILPKLAGKHHAAVTEPKELAKLLTTIDNYNAGSFVTRCALRLLPMLLVRPGELRGAEWKEIDLDSCLWSIPAERMKMGEPHLVPLSSQAVAIIKELQALTGGGRYVFPNSRSASRPLTNSTLRACLNILGYTGIQSPHGFRATARTILDEVLKVRPDFIEAQLAHEVRDTNGRAYNRTSYIEERKDMMQLWSSYLEGLKHGAVVIPFPKSANG